ncbi:PD-(D/E)XK nuclease family protein [Streptomyces malaysiensis]|uniref:PD-(D/E)XK nuclease family protein n=1 Tax=Streptomyces malaysiensis TaxID=92644 RepID=UPI001314EEC7|nr:PD-(D/E)XK nuclease family protein [Streptomyces autolyticus]
MSEEKKELLESFTFGPLMNEIDRLEDVEAQGSGSWSGNGESSRAVHDGVRTWTEHALTMYQKAFPSQPQFAPTQDSGAQLVAVGRTWAYQLKMHMPDRRGANRYRISVWGRCLQSRDTRSRELRLLAHRHGRRRRTDAEIAVAAMVVANAAPGPLPEQVRVVEVSLLDGHVDELFSGTASEANALYQAHGRKALGQVADAMEYRPGPSCAQCSFADVCPALPSVDGLMGISDRTRPRRTWSPTNGRSYAACPAREHMRRQTLPTDDGIEYGPGPERGRAVHAHLAARHLRAGAGPCTSEIPDDWFPSGCALPETEMALARELLRHHADVCPLLHQNGPIPLRAEPRLVFNDRAADLVVLVEPDLLYRDGDSWVWREVKTSARNGNPPADPMHTYPQLALGVLLLARGALGGTRFRSRVEVEFLRPGGPDLLTLDPFTPAVHAMARDVIDHFVATWHRDDRFAPRTGPACASCETARWCRARVTEENG